ncbi:methyltransferase domain-containing protein [Streptomyces griseoviridis]|uniref:Methyltransferase domain-containing protein n=2 Tax=Streptomyces griseoviridis TaxID=45398 RepID=A0A3S9ZPR1_STRGD|nr:methyltransferase domain-containing protein [Streptomyces griseoviridis]QCN90761.1 SAM-dependent methyltransferase [Streptomyces griseoviridis]
MVHNGGSESPGDDGSASARTPARTPRRAPRSFDDLVTEGAAVPTDGWDFSWFEGRAAEARPSWGYARAMAGRLARADAVLDVQTGGGEVLAEALTHTAAPGPTATPTTAPAPNPVPSAPGPTAPRTPSTLAAPAPALVVATEGWGPNVRRATRLLGPLGVAVVASPEDAPLPFADGAFDLVVSRHPVRPHWDEIARVLRPGGRYFAQHVGPASVFELVEFFLGPQPDAVRSARHPDRERADAEAAGLDVVELRAERLRMEFHDIGAVVHFLRKVVWMVPGFTVTEYEERLRALHARIESDGPFVAHSTRHLFDARKP